MGPYYQAFPEGGSLTIYEDDPARTYDEIARWSKKDAEAWPKWNAWLAGLAEVMGPLLTRVPPALGSHRPADLVDTARLAWSQRGLDVRTTADVTRLMTMSIADLLDDWFESPQIKGAMAVNGVIGTWAGPYEPGTAYVMAHHSIGDVGDGQLGSWGYPEGGMGAVSAAIAVVGTRVRRRDPDQRARRPADRARRTGRGRGAGQRRGVARADRRHVAAPRRSPSSTRCRAASCRTRSSPTSSGGRRAAASSRSTSRWPNCRTSPRIRATGSPSTTPGRSRWRRRWSSSSGRSRTPARGAAAVQPFSDGVIPTSLDTTLCPDGTHIMSLFTQWVPAEWNDAPHTEELEAYADRLIDLYDAVAPNFKSSIMHRDIVGPHEMETGVRPDRRQHLPRRAVARAAVPHASGARLRRLPHADRGAVQRELGDARRRRRVRHPRLAGGASGAEGPEAQLAPAARCTGPPRFVSDACGAKSACGALRWPNRAQREGQ